MAEEGLKEAESTWEPVSRVFHDLPAVRCKELIALWVKPGLKRALVQRYEVHL